jgi:hypothetical protein
MMVPASAFLRSFFNLPFDSAMVLLSGSGRVSE